MQRKHLIIPCLFRHVDCLYQNSIPTHISNYFSSRALSIISSLVSFIPRLQITIATLYPLPVAILSHLPQDCITFRSSCAIIDPGVIQSDPVTVNVDKTLELQSSFIKNTLPAALEEEIAWLKSQKFNLCIVDATPFPALASKVGNMTDLNLLTNEDSRNPYHLDI